MEACISRFRSRFPASAKGAISAGYAEFSIPAFSIRASIFLHFTA
jgi:hypothetical protein